MKYICYFLVIIIYPLARENPFEELKLPKSVFTVKNNDLQKEVFHLPDDAREIKDIIIKYKTVTGDRAVKIIDVNKNIDWRLPITIFQETKVKSNIIKKVDVIEFVPFKFIKYKVQDNAVYILTSARNMRHFMLPNPYKIIMDFSHDGYFKTHKQNISKSFKVKSIATGSHTGFFRVALELVGKYNYEVKQVRNGYKITFK